MCLYCGMLVGQVSSGGHLKVIGLDPSTKTGYSIQAVEPDTAHESGEKSFPSMRGSERNIAFYNWCVQMLEQHEPHLVVIEDYAFVQGSAIEALVGIGTMLRAACFANSVPVVVVSPTLLKKFVSGVGNGKKENMLLETYKRWGVSFDNNNACDAYGLAKMGLSYLGACMGLTKAQIEIIEQLKTKGWEL